MIPQIVHHLSRPYVVLLITIAAVALWITNDHVGAAVFLEFLGISFAIIAVTWIFRIGIHNHSLLAARYPWMLYITLLFLTPFSLVCLIWAGWNPDPVIKHIQSIGIYYLLILVDAVVLLVVSIFVLWHYQAIADEFDEVFPNAGMTAWQSTAVNSHSLWCALVLFLALITLVAGFLSVYVFLMATAYFIYCLTNANIMRYALVNARTSVRGFRYYFLMALHGSFADEENLPAFRAYASLTLLTLLLLIANKNPACVWFGVDQVCTRLEPIKAFAAGAAIVHFSISALRFSKYVRFRPADRVRDEELLHIVVSELVSVSGPMANVRYRIARTVVSMRHLWYQWLVFVGASCALHFWLIKP